MLENDSIVLQGIDNKPIINPSQLSPGDVIVFNYKGLNYSALVISTKKTAKKSYYISNKNNLLITTIKIKFNLQIHNIFLSKLFRKEQKASYSNLASKKSKWLLKWFSFTKGSIRDRLLRGLMGQNNFRTFIFPEMSDIIKLDLGV